MFKQRRFDDDYEIFLADSPESKEIQFRLRFQVLCEEMGMVATADEDQLETDAWDDGAVHFILRHRDSGTWLAGLRLLTSKNGVLPFLQELPLTQRHFPESLRGAVELSRICFIRQAAGVCARPKLQSGLPGNADDALRKVTPIFQAQQQNRNLLWALIRAAAEYAKLRGMNTWYLLATPGFALLMHKQGLMLTPLLAQQDPRQRSPYRLELNAILENPLWLEAYRGEYRLYSEVYGAISQKLCAQV
jgi:N-acyl amino acid synthase of PEP-CTERM/exosortase system